MSNLTNQEKAIYAILADNVYWDVRNGFKDNGKTKDFTNSNWTPVPSDWKIIHEVSNSGSSILSVDSLTNGFTARAFQKGNEIVIAFAK